jgi:hypothetical protein
MVQQLPWSAPRREPSTYANRPRAADKCAAVEPFGLGPDPRYARAMRGGCVSWLTLCEKNEGQH